MSLSSIRRERDQAQGRESTHTVYPALIVFPPRQCHVSRSARFVPTGYQSRQVIIKAGLLPISFDSLMENEILDVAFDGEIYL